MSSKEIAIELGLSPKTVDTYLKQACDALGTPTRRDAARLFAAMKLSEKLGSESAAVADTETMADNAAHTGWNGKPNPLGIPPVGGSSNDLDWRGKFKKAVLSSLVGVGLILFILLTFIGLLKVFH